MKKDLSTKLENSLIQLMNQKGDIQEITTQSILEQAGVAKATFYRHYKDKYELLNSVVTKIYRQNFKQNHKGYQFALYQGLSYLKENQVLLANGLKYQGQNSLSMSLQAYAEKYLYNLIAEHNPIIISEQNRFAIKFYCLGMVGIMEEWLIDGCEVVPLKLSHQLIDQMSPKLKQIIFENDTKA